MDKILALFASVEALANVVAASSAMPQEVRSEASRVAAAAASAVEFVSHPDASTAYEYFKHHGNLPGTPESRAAAKG